LGKAKDEQTNGSQNEMDCQSPVSRPSHVTDENRPNKSTSQNENQIDGVVAHGEGLGRDE
jgi:hypothetical protein